MSLWTEQTSKRNECLTGKKRTTLNAEVKESLKRWEKERSSLGVVMLESFYQSPLSSTLLLGLRYMGMVRWIMEALGPMAVSQRDQGA